MIPFRAKDAVTWTGGSLARGDAETSFAGVSTGSFTAPAHAYPCWLELRLTATGSGGLSATTSVRLDPRTVVLTFRTSPGGFNLAVNGTAGTAPLSVILRAIRVLLAGWVRRESRPSPFFDAKTRKPIVEPHVVTQAELEAGAIAATTGK